MVDSAEHVGGAPHKNLVGRSPNTDMRKQYSNAEWLKHLSIALALSTIVLWQVEIAQEMGIGGGALSHLSILAVLGILGYGFLPAIPVYKHLFGELKGVFSERSRSAE